MWSPSRCIAAFPASSDPDDIEKVQKDWSKLRLDGRINTNQYVDNPTPVNAPPIDRMREMLNGRKDELCLYDKDMQETKVVHFMCYHKMRVRLLTHFYAFLFFEDYKQDLWSKRFVRDHLRYLDELQCAAARVVNAIRELSRQQPNNPEGLFDTMHIRRGDFQYKDTRVDAPVLYDNSHHLIPENSTVYIATDERKKDFFAPFKEHYNVYFLDDFKHLVSYLRRLGRKLQTAETLLLNFACISYFLV